MPVSKFIPAFTFAEDRLAALEALAPEAFNADGRLDWDALKIALGDVVEDGATESFGLNWPGKRAARRLALTPVHKTLVPAPGEGVDEASTRNIFIEGDNLDALKLLRKAYAGRVKMIYIDPPYNTGNDFIYKDDFRESAEEYQQKTGQRGEEGERLVANPKSSGRFHSNWLNMIYPRLLLARDLLREDGVIFVSIDDNEVHNLRQVMDEIFGSQNFLAVIAWEKRYTRSNNAKLFYSLKDSIVVYRVSDAIAELYEPRNDKANSIYKNPDGDHRGVWTSSSYVNPATKAQRPNLVYPIRAPDGRKIEHPTHAWKYSRQEHDRHAREDRLWWGADGHALFPRLKVFLSESTGGLVPIDIWKHDISGTTDEGGVEVKELFDGEAVFDNPKPTRLLMRMLRLVSSGQDDDIILDFFGGSASTAHAILKQNLIDEGIRQFIVIQIPEAIEHKKYKTIAEISKERIRRVIKKLKAEQKVAAKAAKQTKLELDNAPGAAEPLDLGFKVFKIEDSPFKRWADYEGEDIPGYQARLDEAADHPLRSGWVAEAVLTEIALQEGFPLDSAIVVVPEFRRNVVRRVSHESSQHSLFVCLDERIYADTIANVHLGAQDIFICFDHALGDEAKLRLADACKLKVI